LGQKQAQMGRNIGRLEAESKINFLQNKIPSFILVW